MSVSVSWACKCAYSFDVCFFCEDTLIGFNLHQVKEKINNAQNTAVMLQVETGPSGKPVKISSHSIGIGLLYVVDCLWFIVCGLLY